MITFNAVKEQHGWAIRMDKRMMTPFWSRDLAIREANCLARAIRCHGECAEVIVEDAVPIRLGLRPLPKQGGSVGRCVASGQAHVEGAADHACRDR